MKTAAALQTTIGTNVNWSQGVRGTTENRWAQRRAGSTRGSVTATDGGIVPPLTNGHLAGVKNDAKLAGSSGDACWIESDGDDWQLVRIAHHTQATVTTYSVDGRYFLQRMGKWRSVARLVATRLKSAG